MANTGLFNYIMFGVLSVIETCILWFFFDTFLAGNQRRARYVWMGKALYFVFQYATYFFLLPLFSSALPTFFIAITFSVIFFDGDLLYKTLTVYIFIFLSYACRVLSLAVFLPAGESIVTGAPLPVLPSHVQAVACVLALTATWVLQSFQKLRRRGHMAMYNILYAIAPAMMLAGLIMLFRLELAGERSPLSYYWVASLCLFMITVMLFYHLDKMTIISENGLRTRLAMSMLEEDKARFAEMISQQQETLRIKHDIRQHLSTLQYLLAEQDMPAARRYLDKVLAHKALNNHLFTTGNAIVDSLISAKIPHIKSQGIDVQLNLMIPPRLLVDDMDLCVLLSNLLINAQEACERMEKERPEGGPAPEKQIRLDVSQKKNFLLIHVSNSYNGRLILKNGRYQSTKKNGDISGIGLSNIGIIVDRYRGVLEITPDEKQFHVHIMLPM